MLYIIIHEDDLSYSLINLNAPKTMNETDSINTTKVEKKSFLKTIGKIIWMILTFVFKAAWWCVKLLLKFLKWGYRTNFGYGKQE